MAQKIRVDIAVIGAGAAGLVVALGAAKAGKKVLLIEKGTYGGDCTNFGCIPSKSLIASAEAANYLRLAEKLGLQISAKEVSCDGSLERLRKIVASIRSHEEPEALEKKGLQTLTGVASFEDPHTLKVVTDKNVVSVHAKKIVIATGSSPFIPDIKGLKDTPFLTNETIFDLKKIPTSLLVIGGGPIGAELSQAMQRLGSKVSLVHSHEELLNKEEEIAQKLIARQFQEEGVSLFLGYQTPEAKHQDGNFFLKIKKGTEEKTLQGESLLVAVGRRPNVASLNLSSANVNHSEKGIPIDKFGRTNQSHIFAIGDVVGGPFFTHYAEYQARAVLTTLLLPFGFKKKIDPQPIPRTTFTDPEIACVGLTEKEALKRYKPSKLAIYNVPLVENDRAITASRTEGFVKIITKKWSSCILGATIAAPRAAEMLIQISYAMYAKIPLRKLAKIIHPYPTYSLAIRRAADLWLTKTILPAIFFWKKNAKN